MDGFDIRIDKAPKPEKAPAPSSNAACSAVQNRYCIYNSLPVALCIIDANLRVVSLNCRATVLTGRPAAEDIGRHVREVAPGTASQIESALRRAMRGEDVGEVEVIGQQPGLSSFGRTYSFSMEPLRGTRGEIVAVTCAGADITDRKRAEAALRESEEHYQHTVELTPALRWTADPGGSITEVAAHRCVDMMGIKPEKFLGMNWTGFVCPEDLPSAVQEWERCCRTAELFDREFRIRVADGSYRWVRSVAAPRRDERGRVIRWYGTATDVHDRKQAEAALRESEEKARAQAAWIQAIYEAAPVGLAFIDRDMRCQVRNERMAEMTGYPDEMIIGRKLSGFRMDKLGWGATVPLVRQVLDTGRPAEDVEITLRARPGYPGERQFLASYHPVLDAEGRVSGVSAAWVDITERRLAEAQIVHLAQRDPLTGLVNRRVFHERLEREAARADREPFALHYIDLDQFKHVNDSLGHPVGDKLLIDAAQRLQETVRHDDLVARLGGDEFAILQVRTRNRQDSGGLAERVIRALSKPYVVDAERIDIGASVGIVLAPENGRTPDDLAKRADLALYRAKEDGRGVFRYFEPTMDETARTTQEIKTDLRAALIRHEFELHYQPIVDLRGGRVVCLEALVRWRNPEHGLLLPDAFVPIAEQSGLVVPLGKQVLRAACTDAACWPKDIKVAVNLSAIQFRGSGLVRTVANALEKSGLDAGRLELEITESVLLDDDDANLATLRELRAVGVQVVLDDFGTGYSSLGYLRRFPFGKIKIDRSFVRDLSANGESSVIVRAIVGLGRGLEMRVVAEGIENVRQLRYLQDQGCDEGQGFLFSRPVPAAEVAAILGRLAAVEPPRHPEAPRKSIP